MTESDRGRVPPAIKRMNLRHAVKQFVPPILVSAWCRLRSNLGFREWEYLPGGWPSPTDSQIKGWNVESIARVQKDKWAKLVSSIQGSGLPEDPRVQHTLLAYAYVLTLTARMKGTVSVLDWGGGLGYYCALGRVLVPGIKIEYHCLEMPALCRAGREVLPEAVFHESESDCLRRRYDLVLVSGALQCFQEWRQVVQRLVQAFQSYLFITRLPVVSQSNSFVVLQRPYQHGYQTEYPNWFFNRQEFLDFTNASGLRLLREFLLSEKPIVHGAPEQCEYRGYLFGTGSSS
jgi:putative methyltransferase (TIGR04325 family)